MGVVCTVPFGVNDNLILWRATTLSLDVRVVLSDVCASRAVAVRPRGLLDTSDTFSHTVY